MKKRINYKHGYRYLWALLIGVFLILVGAYFNEKVIVENGCRMPVYKMDVDTANHFGFFDKAEVNNFFMTDMIYIYIGRASIGDFLMFGGGIILFITLGMILFSKWKLYEEEKCG